MLRCIAIRCTVFCLICVIMALSGCATPDDWDGLNNEYQIAFDNQEYDKAEEVAQRLVKLAADTFGANSKEETSALSTLGMALLKQGEYQQALDVFTQELQIRENVKESSVENKAIALANIATCDWYIGDVKKAEDRFQQALALYNELSDKSYGPYTDVLTTAMSLYQVQGKYDRAEELGGMGVKVLNKYDFEKKGERKITLWTGLALIYIDVGKYHQADTLLQEALALCKTETAIPDILRATVIDAGAQLLLETKNYEQAEKMFLTALDIRKRLLGEYHEDVALILNSLGLLYSDIGENAKADSMYNSAVSIYKKNGKLMSIRTAILYHNMAANCIKEGEYLRAEELLNQSVVIKEKAMGKDSPRLKASLELLVSLYYKLGKQSQAVAIQERIKEIQSLNAAM